MFNAVYFSDEKCFEEYDRWIDSPVVDDATKQELLNIRKSGSKEDQDEEIKRCFRSFLVFGTGGLRGTMGAGINHINVYTIMHATQGFADFIVSRNLPDEKRKIAICYDTRNNSKLYAHKAAEVMAANGVKAHLFAGIRPTPELSFAIRELGCSAGINVTASHNPKEYNGYKVYWDDGAQLLEDAADEVRSNMIATDVLGGAKTCDFNEAVKNGMIEFIGESLDETYLGVIYDILRPDEKLREALGDLKFVYTPVHGAGYEMVPKVLLRSGLKEENVHIVKEQAMPDGNFTTAWFPNPELPHTYERALILAAKHGDEFIIATDPDADRVGAAVLKPNGKYKRLNGNQIGVLMLDYIIKVNPAGKDIRNAYAIKSFVSTDMIDKVCEVHGVELYEVLTGFKYIADIIKRYDAEDPNGSRFLLGFEESLGFLPGTYARDKDAISSVLLLCEIAAYYKLQGKTLYEAMNELYEEYGWYYEETIDNVMLDEPRGLTGEQRRDQLMKQLRDNPPMRFGDEKVVIYGDYIEKKKSDNPIQGIVDLRTCEKKSTGVSDSDMLTFTTDKGNRVCIRPSGTEPKVKTYLLMKGENECAIRENVRKFKQTAFENEMITEEFLVDAPDEL